MGGKGSPDAAGQCLVSSAVRGSRTLISVVLGAEKVEKENGSGYIVESFTETARLFDWGFDNFAPQQVLDENELIQEVPVALGKQVSTVAVHPAESADAMRPNPTSPAMRVFATKNSPSISAHPTSTIGIHVL